MLLLVVVVLFVIPIGVVGAMLMSYDGSESIYRRIADAILFHPFVTIVLGAFVVVMIVVVTEGEWGVDLGVSVNTGFIEENIHILISLMGILSISYLFLFRPGDLKAIYPNRSKYIEALMEVRKFILKIFKKKFGSE